MTKISVVSIAFLAFFLLACASRPVERIEETRAARQQAIDAKAETFASADWEDAEEVWKEAEQKLEQQDYAPSVGLLLKAKSRFEKARDVAEGRQEVLRREIDREHEDAGARCKALKGWLDAGRTRVTTAQRKQLEETCKAVDGNLGKVQELLEEKEFLEAKKLSEETLRQIWEAEREYSRILGRKTS